jgi:hypothetical protein
MSIETEPRKRLDWKANRRRLTWTKPAAEKRHRIIIRSILARRELNDRLNKSEARLTRKIGKRRVTALVEAFKAEAGNSFDVGLWVDLYAQDDPYGWIYQRSNALP